MPSRSYLQRINEALALLVKSFIPSTRSTSFCFSRDIPATIWVVALLTAVIWSADVITQYDPLHKQIPGLSLEQPRVQNIPDFEKRCLRDMSPLACAWENAQRHLRSILAMLLSDSLESNISSPIEKLPISQPAFTPPPLQFLVACILFGLAIAACRQSHRTDEYQDRILGAGIAIGFAVASQAGEFLMKSKGYMAWSTVLAVIFSFVFHRARSLLSHLGKVDARELRISLKSNDATDTKEKDLEGLI